MRLTNVFSGRPQFYDRNAIQIQLNNTNAGLAPHSTNQRAIYTVPSARGALVAGVSLYLHRAVVATTAGSYREYAQTNIALATVRDVTIAVDTVDRQFASGPWWLPAGTSCTLNTQDLSIGGTVDYEGTVSGTEFDA